MWDISFFPPELLLHNYKCGGYIPCVMVNTHTIVNSLADHVPPTRLIFMYTSVTHGLILIFKIYD
jgi:hypothetical protein